jgi:predicted MFS family arabinose efflux permease
MQGVSERPSLPTIHPDRSLVLLSVAHAVNHSFAVLLPPIFLAIIDEFGVTVQSVAFLAAAGSMASGLVQLSYAELTRHVSRRRLLGLGGVLFGGGGGGGVVYLFALNYLNPVIGGAEGPTAHHQ